MNRNLAKQLKTVFDPPPANRKSLFLASVNFPQLDWGGFILRQVRYVRKGIWILSPALVFSAFFMARFYADESDLRFICVISSALPFTALLGITEMAKSASYNMEELEKACKYNFAAVTLARLGIMGLFNMLMFSAVIALYRNKIDFGLFRLGVYLLVPFLLTCVMSLLLVNRMSGRETVYTCGVITCFISFANAFFTYRHNEIFSDKNIILWNICFVLLLLLLFTETIKFIGNRRERNGACY